jgi:cytochrome P450
VSSITRAPGRFPVFGHLVQLKRDPLGFLRSLPALGDLVEIRLGEEPSIVVCDAELTRQVFLDDRTYDKGGPMFENAKAFSGNGLVTALHDTHRRQRRLAQVAFQRSRLPGYTQMMAGQIATLVDTWRDGQVIDILAELMKLSSHSLVETIFCDTLQEDDYRALHDNIGLLVHGLLREMVTPPKLKGLPGFSSRTFRRASKDTRQTIARAVGRARDSNTDPGALLTALVSARDDSGKQQLDDDELTDIMITMFLAGTETTATTLSWCLYLSATHPKVGQLLRTEVDTVLAGRTASFGDLHNLPYTGQIITEVLRLYPPSWILTRRTTRDATLGGHTMPVGTTVICSPYLIHHREDLYPSPERFDPDRPTPARNALFPFGGGARRCIGDDFGMAELTLALSSITAGWSLEVIRAPTVKVGVLLRPHGLLMRVHER